MKTITNITENKQKNRKYKGIYHYIDLISSAAEVTDTMSLIRMIDTVYNEVAEPDFFPKRQPLSRCLLSLWRI